ncbi:helix-turn-helix domain-containing protein [Streptomyces sp. NRRL S-920]|uniref:helix-turn-helix domain-containing protein n=1 Tax=Streptomyces sp. NRRL S-920 TaxID=1463921 RepID=UPI001F2E5357|nr:helix-turn-helix domain-containing protein [Streptomyces sp. NRRL S-920]
MPRDSATSRGPAVWRGPVAWQDALASRDPVASRGPVASVRPTAPPVLALAGDLAVFAESRAYEVAWHRHPAWKLVLPLGGHAVVGESVGAGVLVPPQYAHVCATSSAFVAVFVEAWCLRADPASPTWLDGRAVRRLLDAASSGTGGGLDAEALRAEAAAFAGARRAVDPRALHAVRASARATRIDAVAAELGLSPARLRALVAAEIGVPLATMRQWRRLRKAFGSLVGAGGARGTGGAVGIAGAAAEAGFADQAHLTRAARRFIGRTPGSLGGRR